MQQKQKDELNSIYFSFAKENEIFNLMSDKVLSDSKVQKKLANAKKSYGERIASDDEVLFLHDDTLFGSAKEGFMLTTQQFIWKEGRSQWFPAFNQIKSFKKIKEGKFEMIIDSTIHAEPITITMPTLHEGSDLLVKLVEKLMEFSKPSLEEQAQKMQTSDEILSLTNGTFFKEGDKWKGYADLNSDELAQVRKLYDLAYSKAQTFDEKRSVAGYYYKPDSSANHAGQRDKALMIYEELESFLNVSDSFDNEYWDLAYSLTEWFDDDEFLKRVVNSVVARRGNANDIQTAAKYYELKFHDTNMAQQLRESKPGEWELVDGELKRIVKDSVEMDAEDLLSEANGTNYETEELYKEFLQNDNDLGDELTLPDLEEFMGNSYNSPMTKDDLIVMLNNAIDTIEDEDDKKWANYYLNDGDFWRIIENYVNDREIVDEVFNYYISQADSASDYMKIGEKYTDILSDKENTIKYFKLAQEKLNNFDEALDLANNIVGYIEDKAWARDVYKTAYSFATQSEDYCTLGDNVADDYNGLCDKSWSRELYQQAYESAKTTEDISRVACSVMDESSLDDKEWARELLQEVESKAQTFEEKIDLLGNVIGEYVINDQNWGVEIANSLRDEANSVEEYSMIINELGTQKELAKELLIEAISLIRDDDEKDQLANDAEYSIEDDALAAEIRNSSIKELQNKYSKPLTEELKKLYAAGIGDGTIDPVEISFDSFIENYSVNSNSSVSDENYNELLIEAAENNDVTLAQKCLDNGADINYTRNDGSRIEMWTPLLYAAWEGNLEVGRFLVDNEADLKAEDRNGCKANDLAAGDCGYGNEGNKELSDYIWDKYVEQFDARY